MLFSSQKPSLKGTAKSSQVTSKMLLSSQIKWEQLNPKRRDKSPQAGTLWGDRKGKVATGFLVKFVDGFRSPPHIHNVSYRGVVMEGLVHNDDPKAANMWMPPGAFWTQPKGEVHVTSAKGKTNIAYIEIESGPYLVMPLKKAFDSGQRPVNVDPSNIVWLDTTNTTWIKSHRAKTGPKLAFLWGTPKKGQLNGSFVKLPKGFRGMIQSEGGVLRMVAIKGTHAYQQPGKTSSVSFAPGSYAMSTGKALHKFRCQTGDCLLYVRSNGRFSIGEAP